MNSTPPRSSENTVIDVGRPRKVQRRPEPADVDSTVVSRFVCRRALAHVASPCAFTSSPEGTLTTLFLGCFAFGLIFTVASFLLGAVGGSHIHLPGLDLHGGGHHGNSAASHGHSTGSGHISPFSVSTASAFLAWFGGAGYLLSRYSGFTATVITLFATGVGLTGGGIVFVALSRFLLPRLTEMRAEDYRVEGAVARITSSIRRGGTGEIVYMLGGTQQIEGARGLTDEEFEKGTEVVIHHIEAGIAYVERWDKFAERNALPPGTPGPS